MTAETLGVEKKIHIESEVSVPIRKISALARMEGIYVNTFPPKGQLFSFRAHCWWNVQYSRSWISIDERKHMHLAASIVSLSTNMATSFMNPFHKHSPYCLFTISSTSFCTGSFLLGPSTCFYSRISFLWSLFLLLLVLIEQTSVVASSPPISLYQALSVLCDSCLSFFAWESWELHYLCCNGPS